MEKTIGKSFIKKLFLDSYLIFAHFMLKTHIRF